MRIETGTIRQSPFVGIFAVTTEKITFIPKTASEKETKELERLFETEIIKASIANSSLLGVLATGNSKGILLSSIAEEAEQNELEEAGIKTKKIENMTAVGNLLAINDTKGICSQAFTDKQIKEIEKFLGIKLKKTKIAGTDLVGSSIVTTNKGFMINTLCNNDEAKKIEEHFKTPGAKGTANAGDCFVGNSLIANTKAALAGNITTGFELARIDEGLRG